MVSHSHCLTQDYVFDVAFLYTTTLSPLNVPRHPICIDPIQPHLQQVSEEAAQCIRPQEPQLEAELPPKILKCNSSQSAHNVGFSCINFLEEALKLFILPY